MWPCANLEAVRQMPTFKISNQRRSHSQARCSHIRANALVSSSPFGLRETPHCVVYNIVRVERRAVVPMKTSSAPEPVRPTAPISSPSSHFSLVPSLSFSTGIPTQNAPLPSPPFGRILQPSRNHSHYFGFPPRQSGDVKSLVTENG
jgi:hypothetical protein